MQIAKAFFLTTKENRASMVIYLFVFVILEILFAQNGRIQKENLFEVSTLNLVVQDEDQSVFSQGLEEYLASIHQVAEESYSQEQIADGLYYESIDYALTIPEGFGQQLAKSGEIKQLENRKRKGSASGQFVDIQIDQYLSLLQSYLAAGYSEKDAVKAAGKAANIQPEISMLDTGQQPQNDIVYYAFCYLPYVMICIFMVGLGKVLISFQKTDILTRLRCASLSDFKRNIQLGVCSGFFSLIVWGIFMVVVFLFVRRELFCIQGYLYMINSFVFMLVALSLTLLVSFLVHSDTVLNMVANVLGLGLSFLGGIYVPLELMNSSVVKIAHLLPSYWYVMALDVIEGYTGGIPQLQKLCCYWGIQLLFAIAISCAALVASGQKKNDR